MFSLSYKEAFEIICDGDLTIAEILSDMSSNISFETAKKFLEKENPQII